MTLLDRFTFAALGIPLSDRPKPDRYAVNYPTDAFQTRSEDCQPACTELARPSYSAALCAPLARGRRSGAFLAFATLSRWASSTWP